MRLPGSGARRGAEGTLRALVVAVLAWRLLLALRGPEPGAVEVARSAELRAALTRWSTVTSPLRVHAAMSYPPSEIERDWLAALPGAGTAATWSGPELLPTALGVLPLADPGGGADLLLAAPSGSVVVIGDSTGRMDTTRIGGSVGRLHLPSVGPAVTAGVGPVRARDGLRDSLDRRHLLVLGSAGWEAKFVIAALEERGWTVDAHIAVAPGADVAQGAIVGLGRSTTAMATAAPTQAAPSMTATGPHLGGRFGEMTPGLPSAPPSEPARAPLRLPRLSSIDTARYSAVIAVDSTAAREANRIRRFVQNGGGLVLAGGAADVPAFRSLAPGHAVETVGEEGKRANEGTQRDSLPFHPLVDLKPDAVILERRGGRVLTAARREGIGRIVQTGSLELWRWRMAGDQRGMDEHREWLARLVAGVARTGRVPLEVASLDPAPVATLVDHLGPPLRSSPGASTPVDERFLGWAFALLCGALLLEWLSRRLRSRP